MRPLATYKTQPVEYRAWSCMHTRCTNPRFVDWHRYGGRGITVAARWDSFSAFFEDMGPKPSRQHSLDRIDSDGNYEPGNCRWSTAKEQARNWANRNVRYSLNGETLTASEWADRLGISPSSFRGRINSGWPLERALTEAPKPRVRNERGRYV